MGTGAKIALAAIGGITLMCVACMVAGAVSGKRVQDQVAANRAASPAANPSQRVYVTETCSAVAHMFGTQSRMTDLQQNELWRAYDGKWVRWRVTVGDVSETFGTLQMQFKCGTESLLFDGHARFGDDQRARLVQAQQGSTVEIEGRLSDHGRLMGMTISDAELH